MTDSSINILSVHRDDCAPPTSGDLELHFFFLELRIIYSFGCVQLECRFLVSCHFPEPQTSSFWEFAS